MNADFRRLKVVLIAFLFSVPTYLCAEKPLGEIIHDITLHADKEIGALQIQILWSEKPKEIYLLVSEMPVVRDPLDSARILCMLGISDFSESDDPFASELEPTRSGWVSFFYLKDTEQKSVFLIVDKKLVSLNELLESYPVDGDFPS